MSSQDKRVPAPTVELDASVNGKEMYAYMAAGCCGLRSFYGFNRGTPAEVIEGIVMSGISGCLMVLTDAYSEGEDAKAFKAFVEKEGLGQVTVAPPVANLYTGEMIYGVLFGYSPAVLARWVTKQKGEDGWKRPDPRWISEHDAVNMDDVFYDFGGRAKDAKGVRSSGVYEAPALAAEAATNGEA